MAVAPAAVELTRDDARRIAVQAQLLTRDRPTDLLEMVHHLTHLTLDRTNAVAHSADLIAWSRMGATYSPAELAAALADHRLVEYRGLARPAEDMALYRAEMEHWRTGEGLVGWEINTRQWVLDNDRCRRSIMVRLSTDGPLTAREIPDECDRPWASSGWNNNRNVLQLLACMVRRGEVAVAGHEGQDKLWDLAERVFPDTEVVPEPEAALERDRRRLRSLGIARGKGPEAMVEPVVVAAAGIPATVEGVRGAWRVDPEALEAARGSFRGRTALLSPFDRLVSDRARMEALFGFDYQLEMYKPAAKRRWGYFALPVLHDDWLVGKADLAAERKDGLLRVNAVHEDVPFGARTRAAVDREIRSLADMLGLEVVYGRKE
ncbi:winged helix-turn-helix domain-containing protein [Nakamurella sp. YIM 132087]|uniref:Winged helix-turn-helix domain-containing protein n=1 Tax=Nakamurella alba TaxID=2665158 RepID=A0A7K1FGL6_9ACTN|nr:crosslink repair DNA glycosylase YcaQ family protein [Nakamurella alba]MTD13248.1 winged helix-turn-helix domain-containing protein [Nakamurella alba]